MNIEQVELKGRDYTRAAWFSPGPKTNHTLCIFLDGEHYLKSMNVLSILDSSIANGRIPEMSFIFISHNGPQSRHDDYTCNDRFSRFVAEDVVSWAKSRVNSIVTEGNIVCGVSLSGLASAHITAMFPKIFSSSLCQSGSFWWNQKHFATIARECSTGSSRFWLSVGDKETEEGVSHPPTGMRQEFSQIKGVQSAVDVLEAGGAEVNYHLFHGGHEFAPWTAELDEAIQWLAKEKNNA